MSLVRFDTLQLPREAFGPRDKARAGDLWRLLQSAAVLGSAELGWHPARYRAEGCAFVMRRMTVVHAREVDFGEPLAVQTWVSSFRGGRFTNRQVRVEVGGERVCGTTQEWLHVSSPEMKITRASKELLEVFEVHELEPDVVLPEVAEPVVDAPEHRFAFEAWHTWMDPLAHANHPLYVDWADEALSRVCAAAGLAATGLIPTAEQVAWRAGVEAGDGVVVTTQLVGHTAEGLAVCAHEFLVGERRCATATTVRDHEDRAGFLAALGA